MDNEKIEWYVSRDEEHYTRAGWSREEAIAELDGEHGWIGKGQRIKMGQLFPCIDRLFEDMEERAYDYVGSAAEYGFTGTDNKEKLNELHAEMLALFDKYDIRPRFYSVDDTEEIKPEPKHPSQMENE